MPWTPAGRLTVKITGVLLRLQVRNEFRLLSQQAVPVHLSEEWVLLHFKSTTYKAEEGRGRGWDGERQVITAALRQAEALWPWQKLTYLGKLSRRADGRDDSLYSRSMIPNQRWMYPRGCFLQMPRGTWSSAELIWNMEITTELKNACPQSPHFDTHRDWDCTKTSQQESKQLNN